MEGSEGMEGIPETTGDEGAGGMELQSIPSDSALPIHIKNPLTFVP